MIKRRSQGESLAKRGEAPRVVVLAGPNGAGKSTAAPLLIKGAYSVTEFLNADLIARGISPFDPEGVALSAGQIMLRRMEELVKERISFALEATLAARSLAARLREIIASGYEFHLQFLWLPSADLAVARVADRVRLGGHNVPEETIRRRYHAGLRNFFALYQPIATTWRVYDNSQAGRMRLIASGKRSTTTRVATKRTWQSIREEYAT
jgi:predicted ABC-type ATPase